MKKQEEILLQMIENILDDILGEENFEIDSKDRGLYGKTVSMIKNPVHGLNVSYPCLKITRTYEFSKYIDLNEPENFERLNKKVTQIIKSFDFDQYEKIGNRKTHEWVIYENFNAIKKE